MSEDNLYEEAPTVLYRPSYSATWLHCEAALLDGRHYQDSAGEEAARGTVFHDLMAEWLNTGVKPVYRLGEIAEVWKPDADRTKDTPFLIPVDEDMFYYGDQCVRYIRDFLGERFIERRVDISHITPIPDQSGTLDVGFMYRDHLDIIDWKYGIGVKVFAPENTQLLLYAGGVFQEFDFIYNFQTIAIHIAQPRLGHWDRWEITRQQLIDWMGWAKIRAAASWKRKGRKYTVGTKQCTWCKRRQDCRAKLVALEHISNEIAYQSFDVSEEEAKAVTVFEPPKSMKTTVDRLSTEELTKLYNYRKLFETWFRQIGETLLERGVQGQDLGEWYVTEGRRFRHWKDKKKVIDKLSLLGLSEDEIYAPRALKSPNQMKEVLRPYGFTGKVLEQYLDVQIDRIPGKPTLVRRGQDDRDQIADYTEGFIEED